jgi:hypothetical protein
MVAMTQSLKQTVTAVAVTHLNCNIAVTRKMRKILPLRTRMRIPPGRMSKLETTQGSDPVQRARCVLAGVAQVDQDFHGSYEGHPKYQRP